MGSGVDYPDPKVKRTETHSNCCHQAFNHGFNNSGRRETAMKRGIAIALFVRLLFGGAVLALVASKPAAAADDPVVKADRALVQPLQKGDRVAAEKLLDKDFSWIDSKGVMWAKDDAFQAGLKP